MTASYDRRIARAEELAARYPESADLLKFYREIARFQKAVFERSAGQSDLSPLLEHFPALFPLVERVGPASLAAFPRECLRTEAERENLLRSYWEHTGIPSPEAQFFARVLLQPYAESLALRGVPDMDSAEPVCPFCSSRPVAGILRGEGEGAKRSLLCSLCSTEWQYRRIICPNCGEENKDKLPVYTAADPDHVRVEACDSCKTYIKSVDLTKNGLAVPVVDELATVSLAIWADEQGYTKLETNLLGM